MLRKIISELNNPPATLMMQTHATPFKDNEWFLVACAMCECLGYVFTTHVRATNALVDIIYLMQTLVELEIH